MVAANLALNLVLVGPLEEPGIGLATTICAVIQDVLLLRALARRLPHLAWGEVFASAARTTVATALMAAAVVGVGAALHHWPAYTAPRRRIRLDMSDGSGGRGIPGGGAAPPLPGTA